MQWGDVKFILKTRSFAFLILYAILYFSLFGGFPDYAKGIYGNQSIPSAVQTIFVYSPILLWTALGIFLLIFLAIDMLLYYREKMAQIKNQAKR